MVQELTEYAASDLEALDALMHELSPDSRCTPSRLQAVLESPDSHLYVVREAGRIVATGTLCVMRTPEFTLGGVEAVVVDSACRGRGLALILMQHMLSAAKGLGCDKLHLTSNPRREAANALYRKLGFRLYATNFYELVL